jgi:hypothetical protein
VQKLACLIHGEKLKGAVLVDPHHRRGGHGNVVATCGWADVRPASPRRRPLLARLYVPDDGSACCRPREHLKDPVAVPCDARIRIEVFNRPGEILPVIPSHDPQAVVLRRPADMPRRGACHHNQNTAVVRCDGRRSGESLIALQLRPISPGVVVQVAPGVVNSAVRCARGEQLRMRVLVEADGHPATELRRQGDVAALIVVHARVGTLDPAPVHQVAARYLLARPADLTVVSDRHELHGILRGQERGGWRQSSWGHDSGGRNRRGSWQETARDGRPQVSCLIGRDPIARREVAVEHPHGPVGGVAGAHRLPICVIRVPFGVVAVGKTHLSPVEARAPLVRELLKRVQMLFAGTLAEIAVLKAHDVLSTIDTVSQRIHVVQAANLDMADPSTVEVVWTEVLHGKVGLRCLAVPD